MVLKFKAWNSYQKVMADYVDAIQNGESFGTPSSVNVVVNHKRETWEIEHDDVKLLQYTNRNDNFGNPIHEGYIIRFGSVWLNGDESDPQEEDYTGVVKFSPKDGSYIVDCGDTKFPFMELDSFDGYNVIGDIYRNPELMGDNYESK